MLLAPLNNTTFSLFPVSLAHPSFTLFFDWCAGAGTFTSYDGSVYNGMFKDDKRNGQGEGRVEEGGDEGRMGGPWGL